MVTKCLVGQKSGTAFYTDSCTTSKSGTALAVSAKQVLAPVFIMCTVLSKCQIGSVGSYDYYQVENQMDCVSEWPTD